MSWPVKRLSDLCARVCSGGTPTSSNSAYYGGRIPWLRTQEVTFNRIRDTEIKITEEGFQNSAVSWIPEKSVIVAMYGNSAGRSAINEIPLQACCNLVIDANVADYRYVYYALLSNYESLKGRARGAAQNNLNAAQVKAFEIPCPPLAVQKRTGDLLASYDDLIENNRKRIALLEESARLLYREWFVYFRFPGHEHVKVVDGLPEGWRRRTLSDVSLNFDRMRVPLSVMEREKRRGPYPYYGAAGVLDHVDQYIFEGRYLLMGEDGTVITDRGTPMLQLVDGQFWVNNHAHVLKGTEISVEMLYCALSEYRIQGHITGVAQPKITQQNMNRIPINLAPEVLSQEFQEAVIELFDQRFTLERYNQKLSDARDLLLPRLMSGEIAV